MTHLDDTTTAANRPAGDLIEAVLQEMRANLEPLKYSTLVPGRYLVYMHPREFARLEGVIPILQDQTRRALTEEMETVNRRPSVLKWAGRVLGNHHPPLENPAGDWQIEFLPDPDGELPEGAMLVQSELVLPAVPELGVGERTRRVSTTRIGPRHTGPTEATRVTAPDSAPVVARLTYTDDSGTHTYDMTRDTITIGRGSAGCRVDVQCVSSPDVSRRHARIRRDPQTGAFFLVDLSSLGTTLNGRHVPRGIEETDGAKVENGAETALPDGARIGLAETVFIDFAVVR